MGCDLCGKETELLRAEVEGSLLNVCSGCGKFGKILKKPVEIVKKVIVPEKKMIVEEIEESIVLDFSEKLKKSREKRDLKQEDFARLLNEKWSLVQKWESGILTPSVDSAKRIGRILNLNLVEKIKEKKIDLESIKSDSLTMGDLIKIKRRN